MAAQILQKDRHQFVALLIKMKTLARHLKQAFNALEFSNAGHLTALTALLNLQDRSPLVTRNAEPERPPDSAAS